jgi:uncharacterized protein (TIGR03435 family)
MLTFALAAALAAPCAAQETPRFEVATVKPSPPEPPTPGTAGLRITQRQARFTYLSLKDYIGMAYNVRVYQIVGPDWIASTRFEIAGTIPDGQSGKDVPRMVASLLEERFHAKSHREQREFPVYALETLPQFALAPVQVDAPAPGAVTVTSTSGPGGAVVDLGDGASLVIGGNRIELRKVTFEQMAGALERFVDRPVVDRTHREGRFDVAINLTPEDFQAAMLRSAVAAGISLPAPALRLLDTASLAAVPDALKTLGLSLRAQRAPLDVLVIDAIDRTPTEN